MSKSLIQSSIAFQTNDITIVDFDIVYNSIYRTEFDIYFNTDLSVLEANYTSNGGVLNYISIYLKQLNNSISTEYKLTDITRTTSILNIDGIQLNDSIRDIFVEENKISCVFDHINHLYETLLPNTEYYLIVKFREIATDIYEKVIDTRLISNNSTGYSTRLLADPNTHTVSLSTLDIIDTQTISIDNPVGGGYYYEQNDILTFYAIDEPTKTGISSVSNTVINNKFTISTRDPNKGFTYLSKASFDFITTSPTLVYETNYEILNNSLKASIYKPLAYNANDVSVSSILNLRVAQNMDFADSSVILNQSLDVVANYEIFIPVLKSLPSIGLNITLSSGYLSKDIILVNGYASFSLTYPPTGTSSAIFARNIVLTSSNGLVLIKVGVLFNNI